MARSILDYTDDTTMRGSKEGGVDLGNLRQQLKSLSGKGNQRSGAEDRELAEIAKQLEALGDRIDRQYEKEIKVAGKNSKTEEEQLKKSKEQLEETKKNRKLLRETFNGLIKDGFKAITRGIDEGIKQYSNYAIKVSTALQGTTRTYVETVEKLNSAIGSTGLAKMSDVLAKMSDLTTQGIVANVEQKAFLASIKDGIASTFDVADSTMLRLIKLQGEESTTNRLVMQASLKEYLNSQYENSQYLYQNYKDVSNSLLEATSLLTSSLSLSLESTVQKWLGSLSSVGLSKSAIDSLAQAIGYLGSGDLQGMSSSGVQKLVMMGASQAGLSYSDLLIGGVSAENAEALMAGMVRYLGSLQGNNVILSEYARIFGISVSDIIAARNATEDLSNILGSQIGYSESKLADYLKTYNETLESVPSVLYDNLMDNMFLGLGFNVAQNRMSYASYKVGGMFSDIGSSLAKSGSGGVALAGTLLNVAGFGAQLASALGLTAGKGITGAIDSITEIGESLRNLFASPDSLAAFNLLGGLNVIGSTIEGGEGAWTRRAPTPYVEKTEGQYGEESPGTIDVDREALEEAEAARDANDIYEFLSDDVVTITPYVSDTGSIFNVIAEYNKVTAESTAKIWDVMNKIFITGEIQLQFGSGGYSESGGAFGDQYPTV